MSTLTKLLIVVLTVSSIFLCGIVATYVANAANYKALYLSQNNAAQAAKRSEEGWKQQLDDEKAQMARDKLTLNNKMADLERQLSALQAQINTANTENARLLNDVNKWASTVKDLQVTADKWQQMLENNQTELTSVLAQRDKLESQNKEISTALLEKMAVVSQLGEQAKQLIKDRDDLRNKLEVLLRRFGKDIAASRTPLPREPVQPIPVAPQKDVKDIGLKGQITAVDLKSSLAVINIGSADGVKEKMKFHVTRGSEFICDILIFDVDDEAAAGFIELMEVTKKQPKVGDNAATNIGS